MAGSAASEFDSPSRGRNYPDRSAFSNMTVFCDFDGPIVNVSDRYYNTYQLALADVQAGNPSNGTTLPIHLLSKRHFWHMKQNRVPDVEIAIRSGLRDEQIDLFLSRVIQIVNQPALLHQDFLQPGVRWALSLLHSQGMRLVLVTLRCQEQVDQLLQSYDLAHLFSGVYGTQDCGAAYTNRADQKTQILTEILTNSSNSGQAIAAGSGSGNTSLRSPCAWMIGDTEADVLAGQAVGIPTIALTCGIRSRIYLEQLQPTRIHNDLLSAAHYLVGQRNHSVLPCYA